MNFQIFLLSCSMLIVDSGIIQEKPIIRQIWNQNNGRDTMSEIQSQTQLQTMDPKSDKLQHPKNAQCERQSIRQPSKLITMSAECLLMILEDLNFHDLLEVAQTSQYLSILAADVFRRKLSSKTIELVEPFVKGSHDQVRESNTQITLENFELVQLTFRTFGSEIKKFEFGFRKLPLQLRRTIHELINIYCSKSLDSIFLNKCDAESLGNFVVPLTNVHSLTVKGELKSTESALKVNEIFPNLHQLDLHDVNIMDSDVLDVTFTQLTNLKVTISFLYEIYEHVEKFITRNPQIQDLSLIYCNSFDYIKMASENLKGLESLELNLEILSEEYTEAKIHFANVKNLKMNWGHFDFSDVMSFNQLQSLDLICNGAEGVEFATQFPGLIEFNLNQQELTNEQILKISEKLPNLKKLSISSTSEIENETIFILIKNSHSLEKLEFNFNNEHLYKKLIENFGKRWTITVGDNNVFMEKETFLNRIGSISF